MRAVIMAAGMGRRMNNSIEMPKSILPVGETTIIRHTVKMLTDNGISTAVVVGYRKNDIYSALQGLPVTYYFNPFFKVTNSMASLWFAKEFLSSKDDIILCNADVFWQEDILNEVLKDDHRIVMLGDKTRGSVGDYCFELTEDSFINSFGKNLEDGKKHTECRNRQNKKGLRADLLQSSQRRSRTRGLRPVVGKRHLRQLYSLPDICKGYIRTFLGRSGRNERLYAHTGIR